MTTYEIQMNDRFFYQAAKTPEAAAAKVKADFGGHFSNAFPTGRVKFY
jgi:hypothetical protein